MNQKILPIYSIDCDANDFHKLEDHESIADIVKNAGIVRINKFVKIMNHCFTILHNAGIITPELRGNIESQLKGEFTRFHFDILGKQVSEFLINGDYGLLGELFPSGSYDDCPKYSEGDLVQLNSNADGLPIEKLKAVRTVYTYFNDMYINEFYGDHVSKKITLSEIEEDESYIKLLLLSVRWSTLALLLLLGAKHDDALDLAEICLEKSIAYQDAFNLVADGLLEQPPKLGNRGKPRRNDFKDFAKEAIKQMGESPENLAATEVVSYMRNADMRKNKMEMMYYNDEQGNGFFKLDNKPKSEDAMRQVVNRLLAKSKE